jgi:hypothetical protein
MKIERRANEILIRFPEGADASRMQAILDYLSCEELTSQSKAKAEDAEQLIKKAKKGRWGKAKSELGFDE